MNIMKNMDFPPGYAHLSSISKDKVYLEYGGVDMDTLESFSDYVYIKKCTEACNVGKWVAVPQNPFIKGYDSKVILGNGYTVVAKRVLRQVQKWLKEAKSGKEQEQHKVQEQSTGETDSLPF